MWNCKNIIDLAKWFINFCQRLEIAKKMNCDQENPDDFLDWNCCPVHFHLHCERLLMERTAFLLGYPDIPQSGKIRPLTEQWWKDLGQEEAAQFAAGNIIFQQ